MRKPFSQRRFYDRLAPLYALGQRLLPMWRRYTEVVLPWMPPTGAVLEIGPGPGLLLSKLAGRHPLAVGLDHSPGMLREAQRCLRRAHRRTRLIRADAVHLPLAADTIDGISTTFTLGAIPDGLEAVREMARVLRPNGVLALVDAGYPANGNCVGNALARLWELGGDSLRDEAALMGQVGLQIVLRQEFGAFGGMRLVVARKPPVEN